MQGLTNAPGLGSVLRMPPEATILVVSMLETKSNAAHDERYSNSLNMENDKY